MKWINPYRGRREDMVLEQLAGRGVHDPRVLEAMKSVPREAFVPEELRDSAYADQPLPIGEGQTISQPYIIALMAEALGLRGDEKVLEIGTGSGYAAAVLAHLARDVHTIERLAALAGHARETLRRLGYDTVHVVEGDGSVGLPGVAPYDAIVVTAEAPVIPPSLRAQLKPGGRLVIPVSEGPDDQVLVRLTSRDGAREKLEKLCPVRFVPLIGSEGWPVRGHGRR